jgi:hypothetical protein
MTGQEWYEISHLAYGNAAASFAMILTMASGYLIVSYLVGSKLTRTQVVSVNLVFVPAMLFFIYLFMGFTGDGAAARGRAAKMLPEIGSMPASWEAPFGIMAALVSFGALIICLKFMNDVRRRSIS